MTIYAWFCYEFDRAARPCPVIYYIEPTDSVEGKKRRTELIPITDPPNGADGEYSITTLQRKYPYKENNVDNCSTCKVQSNEKEHKMPRPVEGFITSQGKFFETEEEAAFYEAHYNLIQATTAAVKELGVSGEQYIDQAVDQIISFIAQNDDLVTDYISARRTLTTVSASDEMDGSATSDNQEDDTSVRAGSDLPVDDTPETEAPTSTTGKKTKSTSK